MLIDMVVLVGRRQDLGLVNVVRTHRFQDLRLHKMPDASLAITGIVTASIIFAIIVGSDIRATTPDIRMSVGTRS